MREYKFRVFYKGAFTYFDLDLLNDESRAFYINEIKDNQVMQYTGLKDKNGVETYEGDIVRIEKCFTNGIDTLTDHIGEVKYLNCRFMVIDEYLNSLCPYEYKNQIEVIGNIYENPELLN